MTTLAQSSAGTTLSISASLPASEVLGSYTALSYTAIAELTDIGSFGKKFGEVLHNPIGDRRTYKFKTSYDNGSLALKLARVPADAGQVLLLAALASDADYTFHVEYQDGTDQYFRGKVFSYVNNVGTVASLLGADVEVHLTGDIF